MAKLAVTDRASLIVTSQLPAPEQAPPQPVKEEPEAAVALRVTDVAWANWAPQIEPHSIPAGVDVTVPDPVPDLVTVS